MERIIDYKIIVERNLERLSDRVQREVATQGYQLLEGRGVKEHPNGHEYYIELVLYDNEPEDVRLFDEDVEEAPVQEVNWFRMDNTATTNATTEAAATTAQDPNIRPFDTDLIRRIQEAVSDMDSPEEEVEQEPNDHVVGPTFQWTLGDGDQVEQDIEEEEDDDGFSERRLGNLGIEVDEENTREEPF